MKLTILGSGTSQGVPVIGCGCATCTSDDSKDKRLRTSAMITCNGFNVLIDIGPDFRQQMLQNKFDNVEAILLTHEHNDHTAGLDDVRPINFKHHKSIPIFALKRVIDDIQIRFHYVFNSFYPGSPKLELHTIDPDKAFQVHPDFPLIEPISIMHGTLPIVGYKIGPVVYLTDISAITEKAFEKILDAEIVVISALQRKTHPTHMSFEESVALVVSSRAKRGLLTHLSHHLGPHQSIGTDLPSHITPAHDGLSIEIGFF